MVKRNYEDFEVGDTAESSVGRTVSEADLYTTAGLVGSYNELHTNREAMQETEFGRRIAQGPLLIVLMSGFAKRVPWEPEAIALYGIDNVRFTDPVFIDDTLHMTSEVVEKRAKDDERGVVTFKRSLYKSDDTLTTTAEYSILLPRTE